MLDKKFELELETLLAAVDEFHVWFKVPLVKSEPAPSHNCKYKEPPLSLPKAPVVSAGKVNSILFQEVVTANCLLICLVLSASYNSQL